MSSDLLSTTIDQAAIMAEARIARARRDLEDLIHDYRLAVVEAEATALMSGNPDDKRPQKVMELGRDIREAQGELSALEDELAKLSALLKATINRPEFREELTEKLNLFDLP